MKFNNKSVTIQKKKKKKPYVIFVRHTFITFSHINNQRK